MVIYLLLPGNPPRLSPGEHLGNTVAIIGLFLMVVLQLVVALRTWVLAYFAARACDPIPMPPEPGLALQSHYPTTAMSWVIGVILSACYLVGGVTVTRVPMLVWGVLFAANIVVGLIFFEFIQRFNLVEHERRSWGLTGMVLELIAAPIYVAAAAAQLAGRPLAYVVTAKGAAASADTWRTFRAHLGWAAVAGTSLLAGWLLKHTYPSLYLWAGVTLLISIAPVVHVSGGSLAGVVSRTVARIPRFHSVVARRRTGERTIQQGILSVQELEGLLELQATSDAAWQRLGDLAVQEGYVDADQLDAALTS